MKTIRKYFWQLVSALLALLAVFATYHVLFLSRPNRALQVLINEPVSLVDIRPEVAQDIEVFYKGDAVSNISQLQISIKNSGSEPIRENDYSRPLSFSFTPDYNLADVTAVASDPPNIRMTVRKTSEFEAEAVPTLLNPDDTVDVRFIAIGASSGSILEDFRVDGRIAGIKEVEVLLPGQAAPIWSRMPLVLVAAILGVIVDLLASIVTAGILRGIRTQLRRPTRDTSITKPSSAEELIICSAMYGAEGKTRDVTEILRSRIQEGKLELFVSNDNLGGDPVPGVVKKLQVVYSYVGQEHSITVDERETLSLP